MPYLYEICFNIIITYAPWSSNLYMPTPFRNSDYNFVRIKALVSNRGSSDFQFLIMPWCCQQHFFFRNVAPAVDEGLLYSEADL
jgi:hypothetical protein